MATAAGAASIAVSAAVAPRATLTDRQSAAALSIAGGVAPLGFLIDRQGASGIVGASSISAPPAILTDTKAGAALFVRGRFDTAGPVPMGDLSMADLLVNVMGGGAAKRLSGESDGSYAEVVRTVRGSLGISASMIRLSDATQYSIGDIIANSGTGASVLPITFTAARTNGGAGKITGARCVVSAASGTIVLPVFDLLLFRPSGNVPFAPAGYPADNAVLNVTAAAMGDLVAVIPFTLAAWRNQAGGTSAAGPAIYQSVTGLAFEFNLAGLSSQNLLGLLQAQNTWNPGAVANTISLTINVDQN